MRIVNIQLYRAKQILYSWWWGIAAVDEVLVTTAYHNLAWYSDLVMTLVTKVDSLSLLSNVIVTVATVIIEKRDRKQSSLESMHLYSTRKEPSTRSLRFTCIARFYALLIVKTSSHKHVWYQKKTDQYFDLPLSIQPELRWTIKRTHFPGIRFASNRQLLGYTYTCTDLVTRLSAATSHRSRCACFSVKENGCSRPPSLQI